MNYTVVTESTASCCCAQAGFPQGAMTTLVSTAGAGVLAQGASAQAFPRQRHGAKMNLVSTMVDVGRMELSTMRVAGNVSPAAEPVADTEPEMRVAPAEPVAEKVPLMSGGGRLLTTDTSVDETTSETVALTPDEAETALLAELEAGETKAEELLPGPVTPGHVPDVTRKTPWRALWKNCPLSSLALR